MMIKRNFIAILTALAATTLFATACGGDVECGKDTVEKDGKCVAKDGSGAGTTCGDGTVLEDGVCVPDGSGCGAGTVLEDGVCVADGEGGGATCGEGTTLDSATGKCVANANIECGDGTVAQGDKCVPSADTCTAGTKLEDGKCVVDPTTCGEGTELDANTGICTLVEEACGEGLALTDGKCVPTAEVCDEGTTFSEDTGLCLPDATCKVGDVIVDGICLSPAAALFADPSAVSIDGAGVEIELPAEGERAIFTGTINAPVEEADGSLTNNVDTFTFQGEAGQYVKLTLQALNSVDLVFEVEGPEGVNATEYVRTSSVGVEVVPARYVYIPYDGEYTVSVQPALGWFLDLSADGGEGYEYAGTLENLEAPTATEFTLDKEIAAELSGNSRNLTSNLYKFDGSADGELVTFTIDDFGVDAASSIFVLSNDTPPAVIAEHSDLAKGASFNVTGRAEGFQILVDNNLVAGQKTQFDISGLLKDGFIEPIVVDVDEIISITGTAAPNSIIKVTFENDFNQNFDEFEVLAGTLLDADDNVLGEEGFVFNDEPYFFFYSQGGDFTVTLENFYNGYTLSGSIVVEVIQPEMIGGVIADDTKVHRVDSHKVGQDIFLLVDTAPSQLLSITYKTGGDTSNYDNQTMLNNALIGDIWLENGSRLVTHGSIDNLLLDGESTPSVGTGAGQYIALRLAHWPQTMLTLGELSNVPYDRHGYDIEFESVTDTRFSDAQEIPLPLPATVTGTADEAPDGLKGYWKFTPDADADIKITGRVTGGLGWMLFTVYDEDQVTQLAQTNNFGSTSSITLSLEANKTYYIFVGGGTPGWNYDDEYTYELTLAVEAPPVAYTEIAATGTNTSFAAAQDVSTLPAKLTGSANNYADGEDHYWKVSVPVETTIKVTGTILTGPDYGSMYVALFSEDDLSWDGELEYLWPFLFAGYETEEFTFTLEANKTYYLYVGGDDDEAVSQPNFTYEILVEEL